MDYFLITIWAVWVALSVYHTLNTLRFFQLEEYNSARFFPLTVKKWTIMLRPAEIVAIPLLLGASLLQNPGAALGLLGILAATAFAVTGYLIRKSSRTAVKPLVLTARAKRLVGVEAALWLLLSLPALLVVHSQWGTWSSFYTPQSLAVRVLVYFLFAGQFTCLLVMLSNLLLYPYEALQRRYFVSSARKIIAQVNPIVIGITGSYGKTTTKEILAHLLSTRYDILKTPRSYNTLMGVCKVIREDLKPHHHYFIVEMGAYKPGEIRDICKLVQPQYGILTAIGPQHLERFKTIENVARAKNELIEALPSDGIAVFNSDDPNCLRLSHLAGCKVKRYGISQPEQADIFAQNITLTREGTRFELVFQASGERTTVTTKLLGRYNISNMLGAVLVALECGMSIKEVIFALNSLTSPEHRLQPTKTDNGIFYIDDSYNSNPLGASMALEVLHAFASNGQKVLVTPGYAELGTIQEQEHEKLGILAGENCDYIVLIGSEERTAQIKKGIIKTPFDPAHVVSYRSLAEAKVFLGSLLKPGDVVLFENDLPDNYL
jgi:UDP-N-acetylmuramoyl-tripeptide--D-alanyl-D-alanine ligase